MKSTRTGRLVAAARRGSGHSQHPGLRLHSAEHEPITEDGEEEKDERTKHMSMRLIYMRQQLMNDMLRLELDNTELLKRVEEHLTYDKDLLSFSDKIDLPCIDHLVGRRSAAVQLTDDEKKEEMSRVDLDTSSLLIRYLCVANAQRRQQLKQQFAHQSELFFRGQGLSLSSVQKLTAGLSSPYSLSEFLFREDRLSVFLLDKLYSRFPDPVHISDFYETFAMMKYRDGRGPGVVSPMVSISSPKIGTMERHRTVSPRSLSPRSLAPRSAVDTRSGSMFPPVAGPKSAPGPLLAPAKGRISAKSMQTQSTTVSSKKKKKKKKGMFSGWKRKMSSLTDRGVSKKARGATAVAWDESVGSRERIPSLFNSLPRKRAPTVASVRKEGGIAGGKLVRFDDDAKVLAKRRVRCDLGTVVAALHSTKDLYAALKKSMHEINVNPLAAECNFGFMPSMTLSNGGELYVFDTWYQMKQWQSKQFIRTQNRFEVRRYEEELAVSRFSYSLPVSRVSSKSSKGKGYAVMDASTTTVTSGSKSLRIPADGSGTPVSEVRAPKLEAVWYTLADIVEAITSGKKGTQSEAKSYKATPVLASHLSAKQKKAVESALQISFQTVCLTHQSFCDSLSLLSLLEERFFMPMPPMLTPAELRAFKGQYLRQVRVKVVAVVSYWMKELWADDFGSNAALKLALTTFIERTKANADSHSLALTLERVMERKQKEFAIELDLMRKRDSASSGLSLGRSLRKTKELRKSGGGKTVKAKAMGMLVEMQSLDILQFGVELTAACLTTCAVKSFTEITPREILRSIKKKESAPHVQAMIDQFNDISNWVQREVLSARRGARERVSCFTYFVNLATHLWTVLGDFSSCMGVLTGLKANALYRLSALKSKLDKGTLEEYQTLDDLFRVTDNFSKLRAKQTEYLSRSAIPHVGLFKKDLLGLAETASTKDGGRLINYGKAHHLGKQLEMLKMYQNIKWELQVDEMLMGYVEGQLSEANLDEEPLYRMSKKVER